MGPNRETRALRRWGRDGSGAAAAGSHHAPGDDLEPLAPLWPDGDERPPAGEPTVRRRGWGIATVLAVVVALTGVAIVGVGAIPRRATPAEQRACLVAGAHVGYSAGYTNGYVAGLLARRMSPAARRRWRSNAGPRDGEANVPNPSDSLVGASTCRSQRDGS